MTHDEDRENRDGYTKEKKLKHFATVDPDPDR